MGVVTRLQLIFQDIFSLVLTYNRTLVYFTAVRTIYCRDLYLVCILADVIHEQSTLASIGVRGRALYSAARSTIARKQSSSSISRRGVRRDTARVPCRRLPPVRALLRRYPRIYAASCSLWLARSHRSRPCLPEPPARPYPVRSRHMKYTQTAAHRSRCWTRARYPVPSAASTRV